MISGSGLGRALQCLFWVVSPPAAPRVAGAKAELGTAVHDACDVVLRSHPNRVDGGNDLELGDLQSDVRARVEPLLPELHRLRAMGAESEVPLALHVLRGSARRMHSNGHRDYSDLRMNEIPLTIDLRWIEGDTLVVQDWKTGRPEFVEPVGDNAQMIAGGAAAYLQLQKPKRPRPIGMTQREAADRLDETFPWIGVDTEGIKYVRLQIAFISETGDLRIDSETFEASDLVALATEMFQPIMRRLAAHGLDPSVPVEPVVGPKCRWCPSIGHCPAASGLAESARTTMETRLDEMTGAVAEYPVDLTKPNRFLTVIEDEDHAVFLKSAVKLVEDYCAVITEALREFARENGGLKMGSGQVWREVTSNRESVDLSMLDIDWEEGELDKVAPRKSPSASAMKRALGKAKSEEIMAHARAAGAVKTTAWSQFRTTKEKS